MLGNSSPLWRAEPTGNDSQGRYTSGTLLKRTRALRATPL